MMADFSSRAVRAGPQCDFPSPPEPTALTVTVRRDVDCPWGVFMMFMIQREAFYDSRNCRWKQIDTRRVANQDFVYTLEMKEWGAGAGARARGKRLKRPCDCYCGSGQRVQPSLQGLGSTASAGPAIASSLSNPTLLVPSFLTPNVLQQISKLF